MSLVKIICGLIKLKVLATSLGVEGLGVSSLLLQFQSLAITVISMGISLGVINLGRPAFVAGQVDKSGEVAGTALGLVTINATVVTLFFLANQDRLPGLILGQYEQGLPIWPILLAAVLASWAGGFFEGILFFTNRFDLYVRANIAAVLADTVIFAIATHFYGLMGIVIASSISAGYLLLSFLRVTIGSKKTLQVLRQTRFARRLVFPLLGFSSLMLSTMAVSSLAIFLARSHVLGEAGSKANGLLQVATSLAAYLLTFFTNGVHGHLFPKATASGDTTEIRLLLNNTLTACIPLAASACLTIVIAAPALIFVIYSSEFRAALPYVSLYFAGEFFFIVASIYGIYLLAINDRLSYFIGILLYSITLIAGVFFVAPHAGIMAYVMAHAVASAITIGYLFWTGYILGRIQPHIVRIFLRNCITVILVAWTSYLEKIYGIQPFLSMAFGLVFIIHSAQNPVRRWRNRQ